MNKEAYSDKEIARLVRSVETDVPPALDDRIQAIAAHPALGLRQTPTRRFWYLVLLPGAAAALLALVLIRRALRHTADSPIMEIRTEFELVDQNIKIIFIQSPSFHLEEEEINE